MLGKKIQIPTNFNLIQSSCIKRIEIECISSKAINRKKTKNKKRRRMNEEKKKLDAFQL